MRGVPVQSLYLAIRNAGLASSGDLLQILTPEQCRALLDFDLWERDRFCEENLWEWLSLGDDEDGLTLLQKLLRTIDLKLIGLIIHNHVQVKVFDEPTDNPPGPGFYTPDKGYTWLHFTVKDSTQHFLLGRLMALIFETSAELFYQLLAIPSVSTQTALEEEAYQERNKRLSAEGIPDSNWACEINKPTTEAEIKSILNKSESAWLATQDISAVEPFLYDASTVEPLSTLFLRSPKLEELESEFTLIVNAAIQHWGVTFYQQQDVYFLISKVKGALNVGLEGAIRIGNHQSFDIVNILGLQNLYRFGLWKLFELRKLSLKFNRDALATDNETFEIVSATQERFPEMPLFFGSNGEIKTEDGKLIQGRKAIEHEEEVEALSNYLKGKA